VVNASPDEKGLAQVRQSLTRGRPPGDERWVARTADRLGVAATDCPRGRPRKSKTALAGSNNAS